LIDIFPFPFDMYTRATAVFLRPKALITSINFI
jgi:hypothetical protein